jgi:hypothetical protein
MGISRRVALRIRSALRKFIGVYDLMSYMDVVETTLTMEINELKRELKAKKRKKENVNEKTV